MVKNEARSCLYELVKHVFEHSAGSIQGVTYQDLARRIGRLNKYGQGHAHGMGRVLGRMGNLLQRLEGEWGEEIPHIQSLVVSKSGSLMGLPAEGIREFWPKYPQLEREEKLSQVRGEYYKVVAFGSRWNKVLTDFDLPPLAITSDESQKPKGRYGVGGESLEHKRLKNYVCENPRIVGAFTEAVEGYIEYVFPSLDTVDVLFQSRDRWVAVEVKSRVSDRVEKDYERGIYQCVKYRALLQAMHEDDRYSVPKEVEAVLVLERRLPEKFRNAAKLLGIRVVTVDSVLLDRRTGGDS